MNSIEVNGLIVEFGGLRVLNGITLAVGQGERRVLLGPNGAGKTTLFNAITGLVKLSGGSISLFGTDVTALATYKRARLGLGRTFQINTLFPELTLRDSIILALRGKEGLFSALLDAVRPGTAHVGEADHLLEQWGLADQRHTLARELSYGGQRQLEIVIAIAMKPRVLLLDEPTSGLSTAETTMVASMIERLPRDLGVLIIEHDMDVALALADRITVMHQGSVLAEGSKEEVQNNQRVAEIYFGSDDDA